MKPLAALKKICDENSTNKVIGLLLPRYEKILDNTIKTKEKIPMFTKDTCNKYIKEEKDSLEI